MFCPALDASIAYSFPSAVEPSLTQGRAAAFSWPRIADVALAVVGEHVADAFRGRATLMCGGTSISVASCGWPSLAITSLACGGALMTPGTTIRHPTLGS
ncbi:hypothetical protein B0H14DRAFT_3458396 [Mycena olivaceomarginata]|nr:hypothetical protein B0H14DRAFT_3458396 [Mycena olivaceomarginata]